MAGAHHAGQGPQADVAADHQGASRSKSHPIRNSYSLHIRWQGGACSDLSVQMPPSIADRLRYPAAVVDRVRDLAQSLPAGEIAARLNQAGQLSALGKPFTSSMIQWIR
jgi:hypothetical protein